MGRFFGTIAVLAALLVACDPAEKLEVASTGSSKAEGETMSARDNLMIDYLEFPTRDLAATKAFYGEVFGWEFIDYGPEYASFTKAQAGRDGGFTSQTKVGPSPREGGGTLAVLYADDLEALIEKVKAAGGTIVEPIFSFPGGRRFHFTDPGGNEMAVWSEK